MHHGHSFRIALVFGLLFGHGGLARAAGWTVSNGAVTARVSSSEFDGQMSWFQRSPWHALPIDQLPRRATEPPVVDAGHLVIAFDAEAPSVAVYARTRDRLIRRATISIAPARKIDFYRVVAGRQRTGLGIEAYSTDERMSFALYLSRDQLIELRPGSAQQVSVTDVPLAYAIVPSLIGTDFVYDPRGFPAAHVASTKPVGNPISERSASGDRQTAVGRSVYVPNMNLITGLVASGDSLLVGVWPPGKQRVRLIRGGGAGEKCFDGFSITPAGKPVYLSLIEHPEIWRAEPLRDAYLEKDTVIGWQRPFPARWIGYFFIESEEIGYPFYFGAARRKLWGRYIRSWYIYPLWFAGNKTYVHFEKKFPPRGELLIYYLETAPEQHAIASPIGVMRAALGEPLVEKLLDYAGLAHRPLLEHHDAVCAMTYKMRDIFQAGAEAKRRDFIEERADDVARFIARIRQRIFEYAEFADRVQRLVRFERKRHPDGAEALAPLEDTIEEIALAAREDLPEVSLEEVRRWTGEIKSLAQRVRPDNLARYKKLARQCRSVAGTQDDLARELSILTIRLTQEAAEMGTASAERIGLAEAVIFEARGVLRRPTWWEPRRCDYPKSDPGRP